LTSGPRERLRQLLYRAGDRLAPGAGLDGVERSLVWIFGSPRSGSSWLLRLIGDLDPRVVTIDEVILGAHLGLFVSELIGAPTVAAPGGEALVADFMSERSDYFFSDRFRPSWQPQLRRLILSRIAAQLAAANSTAPIAERIALIKEPNGTEGVGLLTRTLPASRMIFLLRDGRDVVDSMLDGISGQGWVAATNKLGGGLESADRLHFTRGQSRRWVARTEAVLAAIKSRPPELSLQVRYEDMLTDAVAELSRVTEWLGLDAPKDRVREVSERLAFTEMSERGSGKFHRAATPGLWRQNLSAAEQEAANQTMGPTLRALGYE
jgi:hypothetical protein